MSLMSPSVTRVRLPVSALVAAVLAPLPGAAQEVQLRYQFVEGAEHRYEMVQLTSVPIPGMGDMGQEQRQVFSLRVLGVDADGNARIRQTIESLRVRVDSPMGVQTFDSESEGAADPAFASLAAMVGIGSEITMAPDGTVVDFGDFGAWMEEMLEGMDPEVRSMMGESMDPEALEAMIRQSVQALPPNALRPGEAWEVAASVPSPLGSIESTTVSTLRGIETVDGRSVAVFDIGGTLGRLVPDEGNPMAAMMQMSGGDMTGEFRFDLDRGVALSSEVRTTMEMAVMGQSLRTITTVRLQLLP